ncbi:hypothetical protein CTAM01_08788 [Colletotrichum tamarilloi]|uniref:Uncharacterized protein n=1 Tax=Colletotrichum tamarilloi TaxID=1209934 RepID=A0ABQ9R5G4_9PEZI|nr:uncharacterized protein CTAM01_08788 [Colletotrichum tamarilloi]KAK1494775.1 hypothetical protein CTAM01_08788 [Colletotrichum tamarilloi]
MPRLTHTNLSLPFAHHSMAGESASNASGGLRLMANHLKEGLKSDSSGTSTTLARAHDSKATYSYFSLFHLIKRRTRDRGTRRFSTAALDLIAPWATVLSRPSLSFCTNLSQGLSSPCIIRIRALTVFSSPRRHLGPNSALSYSFTDPLSSSAPAYP